MSDQSVIRQLLKDAGVRGWEHSWTVIDDHVEGLNDEIERLRAESQQNLADKSDAQGQILAMQPVVDAACTLRHNCPPDNHVDWDDRLDALCKAVDVYEEQGDE